MARTTAGQSKYTEFSRLLCNVILTNENALADISCQKLKEDGYLGEDEFNRLVAGRLGERWNFKSFWDQNHSKKPGKLVEFARYSLEHHHNTAAGQGGGDAGGGNNGNGGGQAAQQGDAQPPPDGQGQGQGQGGTG